ncbi:MAG TPA: DUF1080 domain-containing protein [Gemmatimonadaceae bacterium]
MRLALSLTLCLTAGIADAQDLGPWPQHSLDRPAPKVVTPAPAGAPVPPPADAIVLFDGKSLDNWRTADKAGSPAKWKVAKGYMEVVAGSGGIRTVQAFGDVQLHVEWATPANPPDSLKSQERGNSGVFLMSTYEVQVLDSWNNKTYADGSAGSIYGQYPPLVNVSRKPGEWQTYDIIFHSPHFRADSSVAAPARFTVFHNGVLIQDNVALVGPTSHMRRTPYSMHPDKLPLMLQDHGDPIRYRNIWVRELP